MLEIRFSRFSNQNFQIQSKSISQYQLSITYFLFVEDFFISLLSGSKIEFLKKDKTPIMLCQYIKSCNTV